MDVTIPYEGDANTFVKARSCCILTCAFIYFPSYLKGCLAVAYPVLCVPAPYFNEKVLISVILFTPLSLATDNDSTLRALSLQRKYLNKRVFAYAENNFVNLTWILPYFIFQQPNVYNLYFLPVSTEAYLHLLYSTDLFFM